METGMDTKWLLHRLEARNKSIASLARMVGRDRAAMSRIVNGEQPFQLWMTPIIASELGVSEAELLSRTGEVTIPTLSPAPIIPWHSVGAFAMTQARVEVATSYEKIMLSIDCDTLIALRIEDETMGACFPQGSVIAVDYSQKRLNNRDLGVFAMGDRCVLRRFGRQRSKPMLTAEHLSGPRHETLSAEPEVIGRVVAVPFLAPTA